MYNKLFLIQLLIIIQIKKSREAGQSSCINGLFQSSTCYCYVGYSGSGTCDSGSYSRNIFKAFRKKIIFNNLILSG